MENLITFFFNGEEYYTNQTIRLNELIEYFAYQSTLFVVEYNNFICNKNKWNEIVIKKNDSIEIITIVGGG
jgi:thiamine biosynthesis protein ThiS